MILVGIAHRRGKEGRLATVKHSGLKAEQTHDRERPHYRQDGGIEYNSWTEIWLPGQARTREADPCGL